MFTNVPSGLNNAMQSTEARREWIKRMRTVTTTLPVRLPGGIVLEISSDPSIGHVDHVFKLNVKSNSQRFTDEGYVFHDFSELLEAIQEITEEEFGEQM